MRSLPFRRTSSFTIICRFKCRKARSVRLRMGSFRSRSKYESSTSRAASITSDERRWICRISVLLVVSTSIGPIFSATRLIAALAESDAESSVLPNARRSRSIAEHVCRGQPSPQQSRFAQSEARLPGGLRWSSHGFVRTERSIHQGSPCECLWYPVTPYRTAPRNGGSVSCSCGGAVGVLASFFLSPKTVSASFSTAARVSWAARCT